jgi:hypothetical protein
MSRIFHDWWKQLLGCWFTSSWCDESRIDHSGTWIRGHEWTRICRQHRIIRENVKTEFELTRHNIKSKAVINRMDFGTFGCLGGAVTSHQNQSYNVDLQFVLVISNRFPQHQSACDDSWISLALVSHALRIKGEAEWWTYWGRAWTVETRRNNSVKARTRSSWDYRRECRMGIMVKEQFWAWKIDKGILMWETITGRTGKWIMEKRIEKGSWRWRIAPSTSEHWRQASLIHVRFREIRSIASWCTQVTFCVSFRPIELNSYCVRKPLVSRLVTRVSVISTNLLGGQNIPISSCKVIEDSEFNSQDRTSLWTWTSLSRCLNS